jgi:hypothetical protein
VPLLVPDWRKGHVTRLVRTAQDDRDAREASLAQKKWGPAADAAAGRDGLLWSSPDAQGEPNKLLWMEGGVEKDAPDLDEPTRTWLEESSEWTGSTAGAAGGTDSADDGGEDPTPPNTLVWL